MKRPKCAATAIIVSCMLASGWPGAMAFSRAQQGTAPRTVERTPVPVDVPPPPAPPMPPPAPTAPPAPPAPPAPVIDDAQIERMTDAVTRMPDLGRITEVAMKQNPDWPVARIKDRFDRKDIDCLRSELSATGYRKSRRADVVAYAKRYSWTFRRDLVALEAALPATVALFEAGIRAVEQGRHTEADAMQEVESATASLTSEQVLAADVLFEDPGYGRLRELLGLPSSASDGPGGGYESGMNAGRALFRRLMTDAMRTCAIPLSKLP